MLERKFSTRFKKDLKKYEHKKEVIKELNEVLKLILSKKKLPEKYKDHDLSGSYVSNKECHIKPDVLLIYQVDERLLYLYRIGSHSELF
ncbi:MAG: type II toxin-antitoxin system mRNA interferase toxin, RelE/StbE family [Parachlamydia sp.]|nr:MAG: type II toxin-antitoxin system mRNA interferase toxin, RelE/StbE family [Parachlamydia sp.]